MSSTICNCWRSSTHRSPVYSNRGKCNLSPPVRKNSGYSHWVTRLIYIFNVSYNQSKAILTFLEQAWIEIGHRQTLVTISSIFNDLANASESLYFDNIYSSNMSACILTSTRRVLNAALRLFVFGIHKSNNIYILVQELDHLLLLSLHYHINLLSHWKGQLYSQVSLRCNFSQCLHC